MGRVRRDSVLNTFITYFGIALGFLNKGLLFPLLLTTEEVGLANVTMLLAGFFAQFSNLGTGMTLIRFLPFFKNQETGHSGIFRFTMIILLGGVILMSLFLLIGHSWILGLFEDKSPLLVKYSFWILPAGIAGAFYILFEHYLRALSKNLISVLFQDVILRIFILIDICIYWAGWIDFESFIIAFFCIHFIPAFALLIYLLVKRQLFISKKILKIRKQFKEMMFSYGLFVYLNALGRNVVLMADTAMLAAMAGLETVGVFTVMVFISNALFVPYVALIRISSPFVSMYWKERNMQRMQEMYERVTAIGFMVTFFFFAVVWSNIDLVLSYLPDEYRAGKYAFLFLMLGRLFDAIGGINGDILLTSKKYKWEIFITLPLIILTIGLNLVMIPNYGGVGAALATCIVYLSYNVIRIVVIYFTFGLQPFTLRFLTMLTLAVLTVALNYLVPEFNHWVFNALTASFVPVIVFLVPVLGFRLVPEVNDFLGQVLTKLFKKKVHEG